jgi:2-dehydro-3-deoxyglucarate aldolase/4-hydroxy-2-oxoheptanedioate aldolase
MNPLKRKLRAGEQALGQMVMEFFTPAAARVAAGAGLDFVIFDMEHGRCDIGLLAQLISGARGLDLTVIARPPDLSARPLGRILDLGAHGVMVPRLETAEEAREIVAAVKYAPQGRRGVAVAVAHDDYRVQGPGFFERMNEECVVIGILETVPAFENLDDILATPGLDVAWMGHYDLTVSMGIPAQFSHPRYLEAMDRLITRSREHGVAVGFMPPNAAEAKRWVEAGIRVLSLGSDIGNYVAATDASLAELEKGTVTLRDCPR